MTDSRGTARCSSDYRGRGLLEPLADVVTVFAPRLRGLAGLPKEKIVPMSINFTASSGIKERGKFLHGSIGGGIRQPSNKCCENHPQLIWTSEDMVCWWRRASDTDRDASKQSNRLHHFDVMCIVARVENAALART